MRTKTLYNWSFGGLLVFLIAAFAVMLSETLRNGFVRGCVYLVTVIGTALGLIGCASVSFSSSPFIYELVPGVQVAQSQTVVAPVAATPVETIAPLPPAVAVLRHGRFIVEVGDNEHVIEGGVFTPAAMSVKSTAAHVLVSNYSTKELSYYRRTKTGSYEPVIGYAVVTPRPEELPSTQVRGKVTRIDLKPTWCPGKEARKKYPKLPAGCLPFGHVDNMMGAAKFEIKWQGVRGWDAIRIHGASGYSGTGAFWDDETLGCTRLQNDAILALVDFLGREAVKEGIEVILEQGNTLQRHAL